MITKEQVRVLRNDRIAQHIHSLEIAVSFAGECRAGQFVLLFCRDSARLLPRPISICQIGEEKLRLVYRIAGEGTAEFSRLAAGDTISVIGPLGDGFPLAEAAGKRVLLVGGGVGIPPMVSCAEAFASLPEEKKPRSVTAAAGYLSETFLIQELASHASLLVATEDGSAGTKGNVLDAIREAEIGPDLIFSCGPKAMLKAVRDFAAQRGIPCYISMEEKMACGIGACLGCVCQTVKTDAHSGVKNKRICKDGPVFRAEEVIL